MTLEEKKRILELTITIHWWNFRTKTLSFKGTLKECIEEYGIKYRRIRHKDYPEMWGYVFTYHQGQAKVRYESFASFESSIINLIGFQLIYLGDRARLEFNGRTRNYTK